MKIEERARQYQNIIYAVMLGTARARGHAQSGEVRDALKHLNITDLMIIAYERSLIKEGIRDCSRIARSLRRHIVPAYKLINSLEAAA